MPAPNRKVSMTASDYLGIITATEIQTLRRAAKNGARHPVAALTLAEKPHQVADLLWRPVGILVRFVVVLHPQRGAILLMCTDLTLSPLDIIGIYGLRFKIEVSFKQALRGVGAYAYHFWMAAMTP